MLVRHHAELCCWVCSSSQWSRQRLGRVLSSSSSTSICSSLTNSSADNFFCLASSYFSRTSFRVCVSSTCLLTHLIPSFTWWSTSHLPGQTSHLANTPLVAKLTKLTDNVPRECQTSSFREFRIARIVTGHFAIQFMAVCMSTGSLNFLATNTWTSKFLLEDVLFLRVKAILSRFHDESNCFQFLRLFPEIEIELESFSFL